MAGDDVPNKKPDPSIYKIAAERLQVDPAECLVVEDSTVGLKVTVCPSDPFLFTCKSVPRPYNSSLLCHLVWRYRRAASDSEPGELRSMSAIFAEEACDI